MCACACACAPRSVAGHWLRASVSCTVDFAPECTHTYTPAGTRTQLLTKDH